MLRSHTDRLPEGALPSRQPSHAVRNLRPNAPEVPAARSHRCLRHSTARTARTVVARSGLRSRVLFGAFCSIFRSTADLSAFPFRCSRKDASSAENFKAEIVPQRGFSSDKLRLEQQRDSRARALVVPQDTESWRCRMGRVPWRNDDRRRIDVRQWWLRANAIWPRGGSSENQRCANRALVINRDSLIRNPRGQPAKS